MNRTGMFALWLVVMGIVLLPVVFLYALRPLLQDPAGKLKCSVMSLIRWALLSMLVLSIVFVLVMRYWFVPREGYPTWEAVRNYLIRDGQIQIVLPDGLKPLAATCDDRESVVSIEGQTVMVRIGYSWCLIEVIAATDSGQKRVLKFNPQKHRPRVTSTLHRPGPTPRASGRADNPGRRRR